MKTEYQSDLGFGQRDSVEREEYDKALSTDSREAKEQDGADLLEQILDRDNLNRAYKQVKSNKGAPGIDGMSVEDALPWLHENGGSCWKASARGSTNPNRCGGRKSRSRREACESWGYRRS